jgi:2-polyprenyl-6-methoxyphenol hydroxylase-like FAD-dependent oxidoreductase
LDDSRSNVPAGPAQTVEKNHREAAILVVGGGPAGLATASALARKGLDVSVVERSDYRDIRIGEHITPAALHDLRALGFPAPDADAAHLRSSGVDAWWGGSTASHMDSLFTPGAVSPGRAPVRRVARRTMP